MSEGTRTNKKKPCDNKSWTFKSPRIGERSFPNRCTTLFKSAKNDPKKKQVDMSQVRSVVVIISTDHAR